MKILNVLAQKGPLKLTHIMHNANVNCSVLKEYLNFLIKEGTVEERGISENRVIYSITRRGVTTLEYFRELTKILPIAENDSSNIRIFTKNALQQTATGCLEGDT
jgi:predicted transcriptional regulator